MIRNIELGKRATTSAFRKMAIGSWNKPQDPTIHGKCQFDVTAVLDYINTLNKTSNTPITLTHVVAKMMARLCDTFPEMNQVMIRRRLYQRKSVRAFIQTHLRTEKGYDLFGVTLEDLQHHALPDLATTVKQKAHQLRQQKNTEIERTKWFLNWFSFTMMPWVMTCFDFVLHTLNIRLTWLGLPKDPFGSFMITSIGSLGFEEAYIPFFPSSRCGWIVAVGKPFDAWSTTHATHPILTKHIILTFTMDHRYIDGAHIAKPMRLLTKMFKQPEKYL